MSSKIPVSRAILVLCFMTFHAISATPKQCLINVKKGMHDKRPPMIITLTNPPKYIYPTVKDPANLVFNKGEKFAIFCPGKTNSASTEVLETGWLLMNTHPLKSPSTLECDENGLFKNDKKTYNFNVISCREERGKSYNAIQKATGRKCMNGELYHIGYDLGSRGFLKTVDLCHDEKKARTIWAHGVVEPVNLDMYRYRSKLSAKSFKSGILYSGIPMSVTGPYCLSTTYATFKTILGSTQNADKYVSTELSKSNYLAKGHLVASADMLYKSEQDSTYFYANAAPMWQKINANPGNWFFVEEYVRKLAFKKQLELDIYVGGIGTLQLDGKEINLYPSAAKIPVPKILYKCVISEKTMEAICFLVVNNPYLTKAQVEAPKSEFFVCTNNRVCESFPNYHNAHLGYLYCCDIGDFNSSNHKELGLQNIRPFKNFKRMTL